MLSDLRLAFRSLAKTPGFAAVIIGTLALGIGASTAIFSVVNAVLLRPLPYPDAARLVVMFGATTDGHRMVLSPQEVREFSARGQSWENLAAFQSQSVNLTGSEHPERLRGGFVTADFFSTLGIAPTLGRTFAPDEDAPGAAKVTVVGEKLRQRLWGADRDLTNKKLQLNGELYQVVGVMPGDFQQPFDTEVEVWMGISQYPGFSLQHANRFAWGIGRLRPGATREAGQAEAAAISAQMAQAFPNENAGRSATLEPLHAMTVFGAHQPLYLLLGAVGFILLIACANLANLLLARGVARRKEFAIRAALGASRGHLLRQLLAESTLLACGGGTMGLLIGWWGVDLLLALNPTALPRAHEVSLDPRVLGFALALTLLTGLLCGLAPALQTARPRLRATLADASRGASESPGWRRMQSTFVVTQISLSLMLLVGTGLLLRSFEQLLRVDSGLRPEKLLSLEYRLPLTRYGEPAAQWEFHRRVIEQISVVPGVTSAAVVRALPFSGNGSSTGVILPGHETPVDNQPPQVSLNTVSPGYFQTVGIPLIAGRGFDAHDGPNAPPVFLINQTMARRFWPDRDAVGQPLQLAGQGNAAGTVVGVVGDVKHRELTESPQPQLYVPYSQQPAIFATVVVHTTIEPMSVADAVRDAVWTVDKDQPVWKIRTLEFLLERSVAGRKFTAVLMGLFAALATTLTALGLYGVISYSVGRRTLELGIRRALGAQTCDVLRLVLRRVLGLVAIGAVIGFAGALAGTRLLSAMLFNIGTLDPLTFFTVAAVLLVIALIACWLPARRAAKVDPLVALRAD